MKHYIIIVPGWGTIHGTGTLRQAQEIADLREGPRGKPSVAEAKGTEVKDWRDLTDLLAELLEME